MIRGILQMAAIGDVLCQKGRKMIVVKDGIQVKRGGLDNTCCYIWPGGRGWGRRGIKGWLGTGDARTGRADRVWMCSRSFARG